MSSAATLVVDTSVAIKWYVPEPGASAAVRLLEGSQTLIAPDLIGPELGNVLWKKARRKEIAEGDAREIIRAFSSACPVDLVASAPYLPVAVDLALRSGRTVYDALYLAVALARDGRFVTADERLVRALASTRLGDVVSLLGS